MKQYVVDTFTDKVFAVKEGLHYRLRWFTLGGESDLCGYATLGTAFVITRFIEPEATTVTFETMSDPLTVTKKADLFEMDFPAYDLKPVAGTAYYTEKLMAAASAAKLHYTPKRKYILTGKKTNPQRVPQILCKLNIVA